MPTSSATAVKEAMWPPSNVHSGEIVRLFHPRQDRWGDHFELQANAIRARSDVGAATAGLLRFNAPERLAERSLLQSLGSYPAKA